MTPSQGDSLLLSDPELKRQCGLNLSSAEKKISAQSVFEIVVSVVMIVNCRKEIWKLTFIE